MSISIVHDDPLIEQCGYCDNGIQGDAYCRYCGGDGVDVFDFSALATLAHNLAIGAGLCESWERGYYTGESAGRCGREYAAGEWRPGCGEEMR